MTFLPFGEFKPDSSALDSGSSPMALNVIPGAAGDYLPFPSLASFSLPIPDGRRIRGIISARLPDGTSVIYVGTDVDIWQVTGQGYILRGSPYSLTLNEQWSFTQWRSNILAASYESGVFYSIINSTQFSPLITSLRAPKARHIAIVNRDFTVLGNTTDTVDGQRPTRVWWSARGNPSNFDPNITVGSGFEDLDAEDGSVQAIIGSEFGTIVMQKGIWRMTYEGGDVIFRFDKVVKNKGTISPGSVISFGRTIYFWDEDGPYAFDGANAIPIGDGKIAATAIGQLNQESRAWISCAIIPRQTVVIWALPTNSSLADKLYIYNWKTGRWSYAEIEVEMLFSAFTSAVMFDDAAYSSLALDSLPESDWPIDGAQFMGGVPVLGAFAPDHSMRFFNGPPLPATIETAETAPFGDRRAAVRSVRPLIDGAATVRVSVARRDHLSVTPILSPYSDLNLSGAANIWAQGRYLRARVQIPSGFNHAIGVETDFLREGLR